MTAAADDCPLLDPRDSGRALFEPSELVKPKHVPPACVMAILPEAVEALADAGATTVIHRFKTGLGKLPVYRLEVDGQPVALHNCGVGGPFAAARMEELLALGCRSFVLCGACGVLDGEIARGHLLLPTAAVRDEGTSFHYLPPSREVVADLDVTATVEQVLRDEGYDPLRVKTWTTDGLYRETKARIRQRAAEGCLTVEMEAASLLAVAQYRGVPLGIILHAGDDVGGPAWDFRDFTRLEVRERLIHLAAKAALALEARQGAEPEAANGPGGS